MHLLSLPTKEIRPSITLFGEWFSYTPCDFCNKEGVILESFFIGNNAKKTVFRKNPYSEDSVKASFKVKGTLEFALSLTRTKSFEKIYQHNFSSFDLINRNKPSYKQIYKHSLDLEILYFCSTDCSTSFVLSKITEN